MKLLLLIASLALIALATAGILYVGSIDSQSDKPWEEPADSIIIETKPTYLCRDFVRDMKYFFDYLGIETSPAYGQHPFIKGEDGYGVSHTWIIVHSENGDFAMDINESKKGNYTLTDPVWFNPTCWSMANWELWYWAYEQWEQGGSVYGALGIWYCNKTGESFDNRQYLKQ